MPDKTLKHQKYTGSIEYNAATEVHHGSLIGIKPLITYESDTKAGLEGAFLVAISDYEMSKDFEGVEEDDPDFDND